MTAPSRGEVRLFWRTLSRNQLAVVGGVVVGILVLVALAAPWLAPHDPYHADVSKVLEPPSGAHLLGTDQIGRDVLSRILYASRVSLAVGFVSVGIATAIGVILGAASGYHGGVVDAMIMRLVDLMLVFPRFFLLLAVLAFLQPSIWTIMAVIGLTGWMGVARLVRAEFLSLKEREFVIWSQSIGASAFRIIWRHILPNALAPVLVAMTLGIPAAILTESGLSFLGLGVQPPYATWGNILNDGKDSIEIAWWLSVYPGLAILITVLSYNLLGEGIRDALDPRLRQAVGRLARPGGSRPRERLDTNAGPAPYSRLAGAEVAELADAHV
ncbi:MAG: ABC transporter permease [Candidatus Rokubacteria bacterium]|nr:ABC transporter permease [Candidatus Rokubacteria bacterium]